MVGLMKYNHSPKSKSKFEKQNEHAQIISGQFKRELSTHEHKRKNQDKYDIGREEVGRRETTLFKGMLKENTSKMEWWENQVL